MKAFKGKAVRAILGGLVLLAGASAAHAWDSETGLVKLGITPSGAWDNDLFAITLVDADPLKTGRCTGGMYLVLTGEGNKAIFQALVAASVNAKPVTVQYMLNEDDSCSVAWVDM